MLIIYIKHAITTKNCTLMYLYCKWQRAKTSYMPK